jgi:hypothetical protein
MRGAIRFHRPAGQQQSQNNTQNELFLFGQVIHAGIVAENNPTATPTIFTIYDLRFTRQTVLVRKS